VVIEDRHTLADLYQLGEVFEKKYGWRAVQIAIHRDEGYVEEDGNKKKYNYHAHMVFMMVDENGIYRFKKRDFGKKALSELQTVTARVLGMNRGIPKILSRRQRLEHREYKRAMEMVEDAKIEQAMLAEEYVESVVRKLLHSLGKVDMAEKWHFEELLKFAEEPACSTDDEEYGFETGGVEEMVVPNMYLDEEDNLPPKIIRKKHLQQLHEANKGGKQKSNRLKR